MRLVVQLSVFRLYVKCEVPACDVLSSSIFQVCVKTEVPACDGLSSSILQVCVKCEVPVCDGLSSSPIRGTNEPLDGSNRGIHSPCNSPISALIGCHQSPSRSVPDARFPSPPLRQQFLKYRPPNDGGTFLVRPISGPRVWQAIR